MSFFSKVMQSFVVQIVSLVCGVGSSIITARYLGPEGRGELAILQNIVFMSTYFGNLGVHASLLYFGAKSDHERTQAIFSTALVIGCISGIVLTIGSIALAAAGTSSFQGVPFPLIVIASLQILPTLILYFAQHLLIAKDEITAMNVYLFIYAVLNLLLPTVVLLILRLGLWEYIVVQSIIIAVLLIGVSYYLHTKEIAQIRFKCSRALLGDLLRYGLIPFSAGVMGVFVLRSNVFFVNYFLGNSATGNFAIASRFGDFVTMLPTTVGVLLMPRIAANQNDSEITPRVSRALTMLLFLICIIGVVCMRWVVHLLYGNRFDEAIAPACILLFSSGFLSLELIYANFLLGKGFPNRLIVAWIPTVAINVALNVILIPLFGLNGAATAGLITYVVLFGIVFTMMRKVSNEPWIKYFVPTLADLATLKTLIR